MLTEEEERATLRAEVLAPSLAAIIRRLDARLTEEAAIVGRVWKALGISTYEQAKPLTIEEHVAALTAQAARLEQDYLAEQRDHHDTFRAKELAEVQVAWLRGILEEIASIGCQDTQGMEGWTCLTHDGTGLWCEPCKARAALREGT